MLEECAIADVMEIPCWTDDTHQGSVRPSSSACVLCATAGIDLGVHQAQANLITSLHGSLYSKWQGPSSKCATSLSITSWSEAAYELSTPEGTLVRHLGHIWLPVNIEPTDHQLVSNRGACRLCIPMEVSHSGWGMHHVCSTREP